MTRSNTLKKFASIGAALSLALGGSVGVAAPASATPIMSVKSMDYTMEWMPGDSIEATFAPQSLEFQSGLMMDDVTAFRGETITVSSLNTGLPSGMSVMDYAYITFYLNTTDRDAQYPTIGQGSQINNISNSNVVVPQTAVAMRVSYTTRAIGNEQHTLSTGSYSSTPRMYHNGTLIPSTNANSGSGIYLAYSNASVEGASAAFTTPNTGTVLSTSYVVAGCIDTTTVSASTTYTASLKVNGVVASGYLSYAVTALDGYGSEVNGRTNSFGSGSLSTWRVAGQKLQIKVTNHADSSLNASGTQYDSELEVVDQSNNSLLSDCTPSAPAGSGTLSADSSNASRLKFTPDSTLGAQASWYINVYKASDNSLFAAGFGQGSSPAYVNAPYGMNGPSSWTVGADYYAKVVNDVTINGLSLTSLGAASPMFTIPSSMGSSNNQNNNVNYQPCAGQTAITSVTSSVSTLSRTDTFRAIFNGNPTMSNCLIPVSGYATARYLNGVLNGTVFYIASTNLIMNTVDRTLTGIETAAGRQLVAGDVIEYKYWLGLQASPTTESATYSFSLTISGAETVDATDPSLDATDVAAPLPVWASNIVSSIPTLTKSLVTTGGSVSLTGGDYGDLKSITIGGKAVAFKIETTGSVSIPVPAGEAGKTADLVIVFGGGTMVVQDAIKYVAQVDAAKVAERPIAIAAGAKRITAAVADQIRQAAFANMNNNSISCVAYAANNTAKAKAAAKLLAVQACGIATKSNPGLKATEVTVIVDKAKAKKEAVGIKVYKATN